MKAKAIYRYGTWYFSKAPAYCKVSGHPEMTGYAKFPAALRIAAKMAAR